jgi:hypothetical protein
MYRSTSLLPPLEGSMMISYPGSTFWGSGSLWWIAYTEIVTLNGEMLICQLSKNFTVYASVDVEQRISKVTYISNVLQTSSEDAILTSLV